MKKIRYRFNTDHPHDDMASFAKLCRHPFTMTYFPAGFPLVGTSLTVEIDEADREAVEGNMRTVGLSADDIKQITVE